jgi:aminoglycoside phosphotransferase (APT) family kinase protein
MTEPPRYAIPRDVVLRHVQRNDVAEVNRVYRCEGMRDGQPISFHLKVSKTRYHSLANEREVMLRLEKRGFPVPRILWYGEDRREFLALETQPGAMLRDVLNPSSDLFRVNSQERVLQELGELVARLHTQNLDWTENLRSALYGFLGEEDILDERFQETVLWLESNPPPSKEHVFVHGDLNDANVLVANSEVTAILDWESSGLGWREYELAWILRERQHYMNTPESRDSFLRGYTSITHYNDEALRWCEVLNCLHVAYWSRAKSKRYVDFNLSKAKESMQREVLQQ